MLKYVLSVTLASFVGLAPCALLAADGAPGTDQLTTEQRLAKVEAELAALRAQLDPDALAKAIADQVVIAQNKARQEPTLAEAVDHFAETNAIDDEAKAALLATLTAQEAERDSLMAQMRSGEIERDEVRTRFQEQRAAHQEQLQAMLSEEQIEALRESRRPPAERGTPGRGWGRGRGGGERGGGGWSRGGDRSERGGGRGPGRDAEPGPDNQAEF